MTNLLGMAFLRNCPTVLIKIYDMWICYIVSIKQILLTFDFKTFSASKIFSYNKQ